MTFLNTGRKNQYCQVFRYTNTSIDQIDRQYIRMNLTRLPVRSGTRKPF